MPQEDNYSCVDNIVIVLHGSRHAIDPASHAWIYANNSDNGIRNLVSNRSQIKVKTIDVQCCFCGYYNDKIGSVAIELLVATQKELSIQFLLKCLEDI